MFFFIATPPATQSLSLSMTTLFALSWHSMLPILADASRALAYLHQLSLTHGKVTLVVSFRREIEIIIQIRLDHCRLCCRRFVRRRQTDELRTNCTLAQCYSNHIVIDHFNYIDNHNDNVIYNFFPLTKNSFNICILAKVMRIALSLRQKSLLVDRHRHQVQVRNHHSICFCVFVV